MPTYNDLEPKLETAFKAVIDAANLGITSYTGQTASTAVLPRAWVAAHDFQEIEGLQGTAIFEGMIEIGVESEGLTDPNQTLDPLTPHKALLAAVRDALLQNTLEASVNAAAVAAGLQLSVIECRRPHFIVDLEGPNYRGALHLTVTAANATL